MISQHAWLIPLLIQTAGMHIIPFSNMVNDSALPFKGQGVTQIYGKTEVRLC